MTGDVDVWSRLASLLPGAEAREVEECWDIGEQEAGLDMLVSGLLAHDTAIGETTRAEIAVLAESWGVRESLESRLLRCRGDGEPASLRLIEPGGEPLDGATLGLADLVLVPWIACTRCGAILMRAHTPEPWGDLSYLAKHYVITSPDLAARLFPADTVSEALTALLRDCKKSR